MAESIACPNCKILQAKLDSLEAELRQAKKQATPFAGRSANPNPKRPGRKKGKGPFERREIPPEGQIQDVSVPLEACPCCGGPLEDRGDHEHVQSDLPPPRPVHTRFRTQSGYCQRCRKRYQSRHPEQGSTAGGAAGVSVGPHAKAMAADLHHRLGVPFAKVADHIRTLSSLVVTPSAICQASQRLANKLDPVYEELIEAIRLCCVVHADETGWRIGTLSSWLWVFTSQRITVYDIDRSRGHEVVIKILGRDFKGTLASDCFLAYDHKDLAHWLKQKCFPHFLRKLKALETEKTKGAVRFPRDVSAVLRSALALKKEKPSLSVRTFRGRLKRIERRLDVLINADRNFTDEDNRRFAKRLRKQRKHLFGFLHHEEVPADNNLAERKLRPAVVVRKTGACNKTPKGARAHARIASVLETAKNLGKNTMAYLRLVITSRTPPPLLEPKAQSP
jgi:hypothetical protein